MLGASQLWLHEHDKRVKAEVQAALSAQLTDSLKAILKDQDQLMARQDSLIQEQRVVLVNQQQKLAAASIEAAHNTNVAVSNLRGKLSDEMKPLLDSITRGYERQLAIKDEELLAQKKLTALAEAQVTSRDSVLAAIRRVNESIQAELTLANKRANKSLFAKTKDALPLLALAFLAGSQVH